MAAFGGLLGLLGMDATAGAATSSTFAEFVANIQKCTYYPKWEKANPNGDAPRWRTYRDARLAGSSPSPPQMATYFGRALVIAGGLGRSEQVVYPSPTLYPSETIGGG